MKQNRSIFIILLILLPCICSAQKTDAGKRICSNDTLCCLANDTLLFHPTLPMGNYYYMPQMIHPGLNGSVSLSASFGIGSKSPKGVGFGKNIWLAYAQPIKNNWSYMLSANVNNMKWGGYQWNQASIGGELNYSLNKTIGFSMFGYKEVVHPNTLMPYCYYNNYNDPFMMNQNSYVGGAIHFNFNDKFFMQISVGTGTLRND